MKTPAKRDFTTPKKGILKNSSKASSQKPRNSSSQIKQSISFLAKDSVFRSPSRNMYDQQTKQQSILTDAQRLQHPVSAKTKTDIAELLERVERTTEMA